jgi:hypothetical protein
MMVINAIDTSELETLTASEEVRVAINNINHDKAPRPDGYTTLFFQKTWGFNQADVMRAIGK